MIISSENIAYKLGSKIYTTLKTDFLPENITDVKIVDYLPLDNTMEKKIDVIFQWEPARDQTCSYEIITHYEDSPLSQSKTQFPYIFDHRATLPFDENISIAVRGLNPLRMAESHLVWHKLKTEGCMDHLKNAKICGLKKRL